MTGAQAAIVASRVQWFLGLWPDRQAPFMLPEGIPQTAAQQRVADAFDAFQRNVLGHLASLAELAGTEADDREMVAFMCLLYPDPLGAPPPIQLRQTLLELLRCAFRRRSNRMQMIPSAVIAFGCGNWRLDDDSQWPEAMKALSRMVRSAAFKSEFWVHESVYGAEGYASDTNVKEAAQSKGMRPLHIHNTSQFAEKLVKPHLPPPHRNDPSPDNPGLLLPAGASRVYSCLDDVAIDIDGRSLVAPSGARLIFAKRENGLDIVVYDPHGFKIEERRLRRGQPVTVKRKTALSPWACNCGRESCQHRHALAAWSPRTVLRLTFPEEENVRQQRENSKKDEEKPQARVKFEWKNGRLSVDCFWWQNLFDAPSRSQSTHKLILYNHEPKQAAETANLTAPLQSIEGRIRPGDTVYLAFSGARSVLSLSHTAGKVNPDTADDIKLTRYSRIRLTNDNGLLRLEVCGNAINVIAGQGFELRFGRDSDRPSVAFWRCSCGHHADDPWLLPPIPKPRTDARDPEEQAKALQSLAPKSQPVSLAAFIGSAISGDRWPIGHKSFPYGMYFVVATDFGFDFEGRLQYAQNVLVNLCPTSLRHRKPLPFEGRYCHECERKFDPTTTRRTIAERVILLQIGNPPYAKEEFLRCKCGNYFELETGILRNLQTWCPHVGIFPDLEEARKNGGLAAMVKLIDNWRGHAISCGERLATEREIERPWCPLSDCQGAPLPKRTFTVWVGV